jgi:hypothetical protein
MNIPGLRTKRERPGHPATTVKDRHRTRWPSMSVIAWLLNHRLKWVNREDYTVLIDANVATFSG